MSTITHVCLDIKGALRSMEKKRSKSKSFFNDEVTGRLLTVSEAREELYEALAEGKKVLPIGEPCDNFDYQSGCKGHKIDE